MFNKMKIVLAAALVLASATAIAAPRHSDWKAHQACTTEDSSGRMVPCSGL